MRGSYQKEDDAGVRQSMEKNDRTSQSILRKAIALRKPLTTEKNWRAQYSVSVNKGWARISRLGLSVFFDGPTHGRLAGPDGAKRGTRVFAKNLHPSGRARAAL